MPTWRRLPAFRLMGCVNLFYVQCMHIYSKQGSKQDSSWRIMLGSLPRPGRQSESVGSWHWDGSTQIWEGSHQPPVCRKARNLRTQTNKKLNKVNILSYKVPLAVQHGASTLQDFDPHSQWLTHFYAFPHLFIAWLFGKNTQNQKFLSSLSKHKDRVGH